MKQLCESFMSEGNTWLLQSMLTSLRTTTASSDSVLSSMQYAVYNSFDYNSDSCLELNTTKCEIVKISPHSHETNLVSICISTSNAAKCLGVWWNSCLSAKLSVTENIVKAVRAFLAFLADSVLFRALIPHHFPLQ